MREAIAQAMLAYDDDEVPVGAVITCGGKTIARAYNMTERLHDPTAHAEMQAITMATEYLGGKYLGDCEIYVTVEPCPMCAAALGWACRRIGRRMRENHERFFQGEKIIFACFAKKLYLCAHLSHRD